MECEFLEPVYWYNGLQLVPLDSEVDKKDIWNFSKMICDEGTTLELIQGTGGREFFVQKTLTYGEALVIWFITLFAIFIIGKSIFNFLWKK